MSQGWKKLYEKKIDEENSEVQFVCNMAENGVDVMEVFESTIEKMGEDEDTGEFKRVTFDSPELVATVRFELDQRSVFEELGVDEI